MASDPHQFPIAADKLTRAMLEMLQARAQTQAASILERADVSVENTDYDNLDGGTYYWEVILLLRPKEFALLTEPELQASSDAILRAARELAAGLREHHVGGVRISPSHETDLSTKADITTNLGRLLKLRGLTLGRELGAGSYGRVFHAVHDSLGHPRAVKVFAPSALIQGSHVKLERALQRFKREAQVLARLRHPAVVRLFDAHLASDLRFIVTDYCDGVTAKVLVERGQLSFDVAVAIIQPLLEALVEVHAAGVLHRDIAPKNVIIQEGMKPVLIDFGLSGLLEAELTERLTTTALGTPGFWAPELVADPACQDPRVDVYSMGALLHYLIAGRPPNQAEPLRILNALQLDTAQISAIERAYAAQATRRYPSAHAFLTALRELRPSHTAPPTTGPVSSSDLDAGSILDAESILQLLGTPSRPELEPLVHQAQLAFGASEPARYTRERPAFWATLLCGVRQTAQLLEGVGWLDSWQVEDHMVPALAQLLALREGNLVADEDRARQALARATQIGWLSESEYDAWRPGMQSGTGMRSRYQLGTLGRQLLAEAGIRVTSRK